MQCIISVFITHLEIISLEILLILIRAYSILIYVFLFAEQYANCIWDKDTDRMVWWPPFIEDCSSKYIFSGIIFLLDVTSKNWIHYKVCVHKTKEKQKHE